MSGEGRWLSDAGWDSLMGEVREAKEERDATYVALERSQNQARSYLNAYQHERDYFLELKGERDALAKTYRNRLRDIRQAFFQLRHALGEDDRFAIPGAIGELEDMFHEFDEEEDGYRE